MVRAHIRFHGTVQGVGFRYTTLSFAKDLALTGWVKNLPDGTVQAVVEGPRETIEELVNRLKSQFGAYIHRHDIEWTRATQEFEIFAIEL